MSSSSPPLLLSSRVPRNVLIHVLVIRFAVLQSSHRSIFYSRVSTARSSSYPFVSEVLKCIRSKRWGVIGLAPRLSVYLALLAKCMPIHAESSLAHKPYLSVQRSEPQILTWMRFMFQ